MKVLIISDAWYPQVNGVVRTYEHFRDELVRRGHTVSIIGPSDFSWTIPMPGYNEIRLALFPYRNLKKMINAEAPDHIHVAVEGPLGWAARKYCMKHNKPFTTAYHTQFPHYVAKRLVKTNSIFYNFFHELGKKYVKTFHAPASLMMVATQSIEDELKSWNFKTPLCRVSRGVNLKLFHPGERTLFHDLPKPIALYVGRIAIEKNLEDFLKMKWHGSKILVGEGPSMRWLSSKYPDAHFVGTKTGEDLADHYRSADVFVFPSRTDTFGIVLIEALASGLPVAGYNVTGPKDIVTEKFLGALDDNDLSAAAMTALHCGRAEERSTHVHHYYSWEHAGNQFEEAVQGNCTKSR